jgi:TolB protein
MKNNKIIFFLTAIVIALFMLPSYGQDSVRSVVARLNPKSSYEPNKIAVEDARYVDVGMLTSADAEILRDFSGILRQDLDFSPFFEIVLYDAAFMSHMEMTEMTIQGWGWLGAGYVVKLEAEFPGNNIKMRYRIFATDLQREIRNEKFETNKLAWRTMVHEMANDIVKFLTGDEGIYRCKIIYAKQTEKGKELYLADYDGFDEQRLTYTGSIAISPCITPDGEAVYFTGYADDAPKIYSFGLKTGKTEMIAGYSGINAAPAVSPDGRFVACVLSKDGNSEIYVIDRNGKIIRRLTYSWSIESSPTWSPDGKEIAFTSDRTGSPQIYIMDSEGLNVRRLTYDGKYNDSPCWSPKGDKIAFITRDKVFKICSIDLNGRNFQILAETGDNENPHFSPDGNHIVFTSTRNGGTDIYATDIFGQNLRRLTTNGHCSNPIWVPYKR